MKISSVPLKDYHQSIYAIDRLAKKYCEDLKNYKQLSFLEFFEAVCSIPYVMDNGEEVVSRPKITIENNFADCKKKSILIGAYCALYQIPVRYVVISNKKNKQPHHIYTEVFDGSKWIVADATYKDNRLGESHRGVTYREVYNA